MSSDTGSIPDQKIPKIPTYSGRRRRRREKRPESAIARLRNWLPQSM